MHIESDMEFLVSSRQYNDSLRKGNFSDAVRSMYKMACICMNEQKYADALKMFCAAHGIYSATCLSNSDIEHALLEGVCHCQDALGMSEDELVLFYKKTFCVKSPLESFESAITSPNWKNLLLN